MTVFGLQQCHVFSEPGRDPRGHYISAAFYGFVDAAIDAHAGDDASHEGEKETHH